MMDRTLLTLCGIPVVILLLLAAIALHAVRKAEIDRQAIAGDVLPYPPPRHASWLTDRFSTSLRNLRLGIFVTAGTCAALAAVVLLAGSPSVVPRLRQMLEALNPIGPGHQVATDPNHPTGS